MNRKYKKCLKRNCEINKFKFLHEENSNIITKYDISEKTHPHAEGYDICECCGKKLNAKETKVWVNNGCMHTFCSKCYQKEEKMIKFKQARVITSKFLQLKDKLDKNIMSYNTYSPHSREPFEIERCNIKELQKAFGELCELLHELTISE